MSQAALDAMKQARKIHGINREAAASSKKTRKIEKAILKALGDQARTPPQIAEIAEMDVREVFWHINALRKYGKVVIDGQSSGYLTYKTKKKDAPAS